MAEQPLLCPRCRGRLVLEIEALVHISVHPETGEAQGRRTIDGLLTGNEGLYCKKCEHFFEVEMDWENWRVLTIGKET